MIRIKSALAGLLLLFGAALPPALAQPLPQNNQTEVFGAFTQIGTGATLAVTTSSARVVLGGAAPVANVCNIGSNLAHVRLGSVTVVALVTDVPIPAGFCASLNATGAAYIAGITDSGTASLFVSLGTGWPFGFGGGGSSGGGATAVNQTSVQAPVAPGAATATKSILLGCQYDSSPTTFTNGQQGHVNCGPNGGLSVGGSLASGATDSGNPVKVGAVYNSTKPTFTTGQRGDFQIGSRGALSVQVMDADSATPGVLVGVSNPGVSVAANAAGVQGVTGGVALPVVQTSEYPSGATPITASATGTTAATTATLAGVANKTTYICGFSIRANATATATGTATVTGTVTATLSYVQWTSPLATGIGTVERSFGLCIPASAVNTGIAVISAAPGAGGTVSVTANGYQL